jgi:hypothetical protein
MTITPGVFLSSVSPPRKRVSRASDLERPWIPAFAGMT